MFACLFVVVVFRIFVLGVAIYQSRSPSRDEGSIIWEIVPIETGGLSVFRLVSNKLYQRAQGTKEDATFGLHYVIK